MQVSITEWEEDLEATSQCQRSVTETIKKRDSIFPTVLRSLSSETVKIWTCFWWTIEHSVLRLPITSVQEYFFILLNQTRAEIVKRAQQIRVTVTNARSKVRTEEKKQEAWWVWFLYQLS